MSQLQYSKMLINGRSLVKHTAAPARPWILGRRLMYGYISPIDKPVISLSLKSFHQMSSELMALVYTESSALVCPELSILLGAVAFRLGLGLVSGLIKSFKYTNKNNLSTRDYVTQRCQSDDRLLVRWIDRVFILDSVRDMQFYGIVKEDINRAIYRYYRPGAIIATVFNGYMCLNFLRGAHNILTDPIYAQFCQGTCYLGNLALHDVYFMTPVLLIMANYWLLRGSRHPLFINIANDNNKLMCFNIAFMAGLVFVPIPGVYHFAYLGLVLGHIGARAVRLAMEDGRSLLRKLMR